MRAHIDIQQNARQALQRPRLGHPCQRGHEPGESGNLLIGEATGSLGCKARGVDRAIGEEKRRDQVVRHALRLQLACERKIERTVFVLELPTKNDCVVMAYLTGLRRNSSVWNISNDASPISTGAP